MLHFAVESSDLYSDAGPTLRWKVGNIELREFQIHYQEVLLMSISRREFLRKAGLGSLALTSFATFVSTLASSAFAQVGFRAAPVVQGTTTVTGQPIEFPLFRNQIASLLVEIAPGGETGRHLHPVPTFVYVLEGTTILAIDGRAPLTYTAGQAVLEPVNTWHNSLNRGATPVKFLGVFAAEEGKPATIRP